MSEGLHVVDASSAALCSKVPNQFGAFIRTILHSRSHSGSVSSRDGTQGFFFPFLSLLDGWQAE